MAQRRRLIPTLIVAATALGLGASLADFYAHWQSGLRPESHAYGAAVYALGLLQAILVGVAAIMSLYTVARWLAGYIHAERRSTFDSTMLLWFYVVGQGLVGLALVHGFPSLMGGG